MGGCSTTHLTHEGRVEDEGRHAAVAQTPQTALEAGGVGTPSAHHQSGTGVEGEGPEAECWEVDADGLGAINGEGESLLAPLRQCHLMPLPIADAWQTPIR